MKWQVPSVPFFFSLYDLPARVRNPVENLYSLRFKESSVCV